MPKDGIYLEVEGLLPRNTKVTSTWLDHTKAIGKIVGYASLAEGNGDFQPAYLVELSDSLAVARDERVPGVTHINIITLRADRVVEVKDHNDLGSLKALIVIEKIVVLLGNNSDEVQLITKLTGCRGEQISFTVLCPPKSGKIWAENRFPDTPKKVLDITWS